MRRACTVPSSPLVSYAGLCMSQLRVCNRSANRRLTDHKDSFIIQCCNSEPQRPLGIEAQRKQFKYAEIKSSVAGCRFNTLQVGIDGNSTFL